MVDFLANELAAGKQVQVKGLGKFEAVEKPAKDVVKKKTGETVSRPAHKAAKFSPAKPLKERLSAAP